MIGGVYTYKFSMSTKFACPDPLVGPPPAGGGGAPLAPVGIGGLFLILYVYFLILRIFVRPFIPYYYFDAFVE